MLAMGMNGRNFRGSPGPTRCCRTSDDEEEEEMEEEEDDDDNGSLFNISNSIT